MPLRSASVAAAAPSDLTSPQGNSSLAASSETAAGSAFARFRRVSFFGSLDGLRAISILAVIWHHTAAAAVSERFAFLHHGNRGVMLFFVISAFLISTLLLRAKERQTLHVPRFWARRALRIMPLFYLVLAVYVVVVAVLERDGVARSAFFGNLPAFATFTSNWFVELDNARVIFYFAWSLAAEEQFYLCWPWIERYTSKAWPVVIAVAALVVSQVFGYQFATHATTSLAAKIVASVPAAILLGVVLAHALHHRRVFEVLWRWAGRRGAAIVALAMVIAALSGEARLGFAGELVTAAALMALVLTCVIREDNDLAPFLRLRAIAWIGTVSYGIYLVHMLSVGVARKAFAAAGLASPYWDFVGGATLSLAAASVSYWTFERYFLRLKDRWFAERTSRSPAAPEHPVSGAAGVSGVTAGPTPDAVPSN